jgi:hypothetical protein
LVKSTAKVGQKHTKEQMKVRLLITKRKSGKG